MFMMMIMSVVFLMMLLILMFMNFYIFKKSFKLRNKSSPFECGFDNMTKLRLPFSLHFFLIAMVFLIFDIEISLMLPVIKSFSFKFNLDFFFLSIILILGLYYEWKEGSLKWLKSDKKK